MLGALGCVKSHILALKDAKLNGYNNCLILEDDFTAYDVDILIEIKIFLMMLNNGTLLCYLLIYFNQK
jgi:hypothetical protein